MQTSGAIQAETDQVIVILEELAPLIVQQGAVGLYGILETHVLYACHTRLTILFLALDGFVVEIDPHQRWLAALAGYSNLRAAVRLDQLADISLQSLFAHTKLDIGVAKFLVQEETVRTAQVAGGARGLG